MPTPNVVTLNAVSVAIDAAVTTPYSSGATQRASSSVPTRPITRVARLVGSVHATPRIVRAVKLVGGALGGSVMMVAPELDGAAASYHLRRMLRWAAMKLAVIGSGYVGLVTGAGFSDFGNHVTCVDIDQARIDRLRRGEIPFFEPGLPELVQRNVKQGRLTFTSDTVDAVREAEVVFLAVGTPSRPDGAADLSYLLEAARQVGKGLGAHGTIIVTKIG